MEPITGKNVTIQFLKGDDYYDYACATDISIDFNLETKAVRTYSQGTWNKPRGQRHSYGISLSGLIVFDEPTLPGAFDLLEYLRAMSAVQYRMFFDEPVSNTLKLIEGIALPVGVSLSGGAEGFGQGNIELEGDGEPDIRNAIINCPSSVLTIELNEAQTAILITGHTGEPVRYDYGIDGGGLTTAFIFTDPAELDLPDDIAEGEHTIQIFPVCENGDYGTEFNGEFEIVVEPPPEPPTCAAPTGLVITDITETSAIADWAAVIPTPADGYEYELTQGITLIDSGTVTSSGVGFGSGLAPGTTYGFRVRSACGGGDFSTWVTTSFTTVSSVTDASYDWSYEETGGASGNLQIKEGATVVINTGATNDSGSEIVSPLADINVRVIGMGGSFKQLIVTDVTAGTTIYNNVGTVTQQVTFTPIAGHLYNIVATVSI